MIIAALVMLVLGIAVLAYVLEPVIRARVDRVEIDATMGTPPTPDFRLLLDEDDLGLEQETAEEPRSAPHSVEPAEHRS